MPSFKSGLRNSYRIEHGSGVAGTLERTADMKQGETRVKDYNKRGSSLPANCSTVSVQLLPSLRHSATDPDICSTKMIPKDVIETDYLFSPTGGNRNSRVTTETTQKSLCGQSESNEVNLNSEKCRNLQKALLEGLGQKLLHGRRNNATESRSYKLLLNSDLLDRVSLDILRMSQREPSGVNGCRLRTHVERQNSADMDLGYVRVDEDTQDTFEIVVSLKESVKPSEDLRRPTKDVSSLVASIFSNPIRRSQKVQPISVYVGDAYQLEKIKLHPNCNQSSSNALLCSS